MESLSYFIHGVPQSKGSLTRMPNGAMLPAGTRASRERKGVWRDDVRNATLDAVGDDDVPRGPVRLLADFVMPYPVSSIRKYQLGWWPHVKKPDVDKLLRALLDPMKGVAWWDDSQVCIVMVSKSYAWDGRTGCRVIVDYLTDDYMQEWAMTRRGVMDAMERLS